MTLRVFSDSRCLQHVVPQGFPEVPDRLEGLIRGMRSLGMEVVEAGEHPGTEAAIQAVHDKAYIRRFQNAVASGELFLDTGDNPLCGSTWEAAHAAVDACLFAADWIFSDSASPRSFAMVRPPGHHAERAMAMGFCYFNNVAIAAEYMVRQHGCDRVAIVDFDVHHGNGTQHLFEDRADVLYVSSHQHPLFPGTGTAEERGVGEGMGTTVNIPLPAGTGDTRYREVFSEEILPAVHEFNPDVLLVSAGFDSWRADPVGGMQVSAEAFEAWGRWLRGAADELCDGRMFVTLEGGYDLTALTALVAACCRGMESGS